MNETLRALQKRAFHFSRNAAAHGKACFCGRFDIGFCEDQCCGGSNEVRRENRFAQRVHGNIADIMVMHAIAPRSEEHTSELQSLMRISYAVFCLKKKQITKRPTKED